MNHRHEAVLRQRLTEALTSFLKPGKGANGTPNELAGMSACLDAIHEFLLERGIATPDLLRPIIELNGAVGELANGGAPALLREHRKVGRPAIGHNDRALFVSASAAVSLLHMSGMPLRDACRRAVAILAKRGFSFGGLTGPDWKALYNVRKKLMRGYYGIEFKDLHSRLVSDLPSYSSDPKSSAEILLREFRSLHRPNDQG